MRLLWICHLHHDDGDGDGFATPCDGDGGGDDDGDDDDGAGVGCRKGEKEIGVEYMTRIAYAKILTHQCNNLAAKPNTNLSTHQNNNQNNPNPPMNESKQNQAKSISRIYPIGENIAKICPILSRKN